jgi:hypothetical protein
LDLVYHSEATEPIANRVGIASPDEGGDAGGDEGRKVGKEGALDLVVLVICVRGGKWEDEAYHLLWPGIENLRDLNTQYN